jgi:hypothetical protein
MVEDEVWSLIPLPCSALGNPFLLIFQDVAGRRRKELTFPGDWWHPRSQPQGKLSAFQGLDEWACLLHAHGKSFVTEVQLNGTWVTHSQAVVGTADSALSGLTWAGAPSKDLRKAESRSYVH